MVPFPLKQQCSTMRMPLAASCPVHLLHPLHIRMPTPIVCLPQRRHDRLGGHEHHQHFLPSLLHLQRNYHLPPSWPSMNSHQTYRLRGLSSPQKYMAGNVAIPLTTNVRVPLPDLQPSQKNLRRQMRNVNTQRRFRYLVRAKADPGLAALSATQIETHTLSRHYRHQSPQR
jgi:hypothetical protein